MYVVLGQLRRYTKEQLLEHNGKLGVWVESAAGRVFLTASEVSDSFGSMESKHGGEELEPQVPDKDLTPVTVTSDTNLEQLIHDVKSIAGIEIGFTKGGGLLDVAWDDDAESKK